MSQLTNEILEKLFRLRETDPYEVLSSEYYGCYYCNEIFHGKNLVCCYTTIVCPHCGIDSVVPIENPVMRVNHQILGALRDKYFYNRSLNPRKVSNGSIKK